MPRTEDEITSRTTEVVSTWMEARSKKFTETASTMTLNPFLMPLVASMHGIEDPELLTRLMIEAHLVGGHNTGFGKLIDEKLLPQVFGTTKLTGPYRKTNSPFSQAAFNEIDHLVPRDEGSDLLSLKASRWTINLSGAINLNHSFRDLVTFYVKPYPTEFRSIVVGVLFGQDGALGDKYQIARGELQRQRDKHGVVDLTANVGVVAGRVFWQWLNDDEPATQDWVLNGVLAAAAANSSSGRPTPEAMWREDRVVSELEDGSGGLDWHAVLKAVSG